jgi:hypothetical protein
LQNLTEKIDTQRDFFVEDYIRDLKSSGELRKFVENNDGKWNHDQWLSFLDRLKKLGYEAIPPDKIGELLEVEREHYKEFKSKKEGAIKALAKLKEEKFIPAFVEKTQAAGTFEDLLKELDDERFDYGKIELSTLSELLEQERSAYLNEQKKKVESLEYRETMVQQNESGMAKEGSVLREEKKEFREKQQALESTMNQVQHEHEVIAEIVKEKQEIRRGTH